MEPKLFLSGAERTGKYSELLVVSGLANYRIAVEQRPMSLAVLPVMSPLGVDDLSMLGQVLNRVSANEVHGRYERVILMAVEQVRLDELTQFVRERRPIVISEGRLFTAQLPDVNITPDQFFCAVGQAEQIE